jgi:hypothetical protein
MRLPPDPAPYHAYLLRCWLERGPGPDAPGAWRFSLEDPHTGARRGFAGLSALVAFLERVLAGEGGGGGDGPDPGPAVPAGDSGPAGAPGG